MAILPTDGANDEMLHAKRRGRARTALEALIRSTIGEPLGQRADVPATERGVKQIPKLSVLPPAQRRAMFAKGPKPRLG